MAEINFKISITPKAACDMLQELDSAELIYDELKRPAPGKEIAILVFEKYYFRSENRAAMTVIIDNFEGVTYVKAIAAGSSQGFIFNFDWGAADNFVESVRKVFKEYILE
ncbi:DUF6054 family protein [Lutispora sp.]|uniref:DUF6054 family protein n=1 Tax=Lutispora sp. TaxID=2828727 RepID=UPI000EC882CB|nr:DUF6054 family protein [Lutispora sp.]MEA4961394.1 DUF6054 family protein [Lutispora sp.]HCJ56102.1 hypothetical protein [Clostridiaceae bacterium]